MAVVLYAPSLALNQGIWVVGCGLTKFLSMHHLFVCAFIGLLFVFFFKNPKQNQKQTKHNNTILSKCLRLRSIQTFCCSDWLCSVLCLVLVLLCISVLSCFAMKRELVALL